MDPKKKERLDEVVNKKLSRGVPIKYQVLELVKRQHPLNTREVASTLNLGIGSVREALTTLRQEGKLSNHTVNSRKPRIWYP